MKADRLQVDELEDVLTPERETPEPEPVEVRTLEDATRIGRILRLQQSAGNQAVARLLLPEVGTETGTTGPAATEEAPEAEVSDPAVDALDLKPKAKAIANALKKKFPAITFTSGKRDQVSEQASAMAGNVVSNRKWITETYADKTLTALLQKWLDDNPSAVTKDTIAAGLTEVMSTWTADQMGKLSAHFSGEAFDIQPQTDKADEIKAEAGKLATAQGGKFLEKEGGLVRWHLQVRE